MACICLGWLGVAPRPVCSYFYVLVNLRPTPLPHPSTPKNIDLADSTPGCPQNPVLVLWGGSPGIDFSPFIAQAEAPESEIYFSVNSLLRDWVLSADCCSLIVNERSRL